MSVLALDVGGTTVRGAVRDAAGSTIVERVVTTGDRDPDLAALWDVATELTDAAQRSGHQVRAVGLGMPEYVDRAGHLTSRDVLDWSVQPRRMLAEIAPIVVVESDVRCSAYAELHRAEDTDSFAVISIGTGLSHACVHEGRLVRGHRGEAIGLGQLPASPAAGPGRTVEDLASGSGLARRYTERTGRPLSDGAREVVQRSLAGDEAARDVLVEAGQALAYATWVLVQITDPARIVLTGGLGSSPSPLHDHLDETYREFAADRPGAPPIGISRDGDRAGLRGAELLARRALTDQEAR